MRNRGAHQDYRRRLGRLIGMINYREWKVENLPLTEREKGFLRAEMSALNWAVMLIGERDYDWYAEAIDDATDIWEKQKVHLEENKRKREQAGQNRAGDYLRDGTAE